MNCDIPIVTITLLTYNHEKYIRECLDGILKQKTSFQMEVIVGDDCSTDGTRDVLIEYEKNYPGFFSMILRKENIGATANLYDLLKRARGKYIAGLEGDDYWFDPNKIEEQVRFLETHMEYIGCSQEVHCIDQEGNTMHFDGKYIDGRHWTYYQNVFTYEEYKKFILPGQGSTYLYRNVFLDPKYDYSIIEKASPMVGDMTLMLILSSQGDWWFMKDKVTTCYRFVSVHGGGSWASWIINSNRGYDDYMYRCRLEEYARKELGVKLDLSSRKQEILYVAYCRYLWEKNDENKKVLINILKNAHPLIVCVCRMLFRRIKNKYTPSTISYAIECGQTELANEKLKKGTWKEFDKCIKGKTLVAFGSGNSFGEFIDKYGGKYDVACVIDNDPCKIGTTYERWKSLQAVSDGHYFWAPIISSDEVNNWEKDNFVILITSTLFENEIADQLDALGVKNYFSLGIMESKVWYYRWTRKR